MKLLRTTEMVADGHFAVGDVITFTLNDGETVEALAVKQEQDGMIFVLVDCLKEEYCMNPTNSNVGGYAGSSLRAALNTEIIARFPAEIREQMVAFENGDFLRLPTEREIFGENVYGEAEPDTVSQWEPMKNRRNRIAFQGSQTGTWEWCWLQNAVRNSAAPFAYVNDNGYAYYYYASYSIGVRPAFKIKKRTP